MKRTVTVNGRQFEVECNAATPIIYNRIFGENLLSRFSVVSGMDADSQMDFVQKMIFIFNRTAEIGVKETLKQVYDNYIEWLTGFEVMSFADQELLATITEMWQVNNKGTSKIKNQNSPQ